MGKCRPRHIERIKLVSEYFEHYIIAVPFLVGGNDLPRSFSLMRGSDYAAPVFQKPPKMLTGFQI